VADEVERCVVFRRPGGFRNVERLLRAEGFAAMREVTTELKFRASLRDKPVAAKARRANTGPRKSTTKTEVSGKN
jgi:hypothetical protein